MKSSKSFLRNPWQTLAEPRLKNTDLDILYLSLSVSRQTKTHICTQYFAASLQADKTSNTFC